MAAALGVAAIGAWAVATRQVSYEITHGVSMNPVYHQGDLVFLAKADSYAVGEIAAYRGAYDGPVVLHRIIGGDASGFTFKGDNNQSTDVDKPSADKLIGRAVLHIPKGGYWLGPLLSPTGLGMIGFMIISGGGAAAKTRRDRKRARRNAKIQSVSRHFPRVAVPLVIRSIVELPPRLRAATAGLTTMTLLGITLALLAFAGPVVELVRPGSGGVSSTGQSMTFSYSASVPRTPVYDGTTVRSPDPIFRKLAHVVDVRFVYRGSPGSVVVDATLSSDSGWHTSIVLAPLTNFGADHYHGMIHLDLDKLEARGNAAAAAIGVQPGPLNVALSPRVTTPGAPTFAPTLPLSLAPLELTLPGGEGSLVVDATPAPRSTALAAVRPRDVSAFGVTLMSAAAARRWSVFLLLGALLGAIGIVFAARRNAPARSDAEIRRRYSPLLVPVEPMEPMISPPGKLIVNVNELKALARLAESYGLLILCWSRTDSETFVVQDEGITYRYRTDAAADGAPLAMIDGQPPRTAPPVVSTPARTRGRHRATNAER